MTNLNLLKDNERKVFYHYLIPSICSTLVTSIYILVDTLIIGQGVGAEGISALNIFLPFFTIYNGIGLMFGLGGGILISIEDGIGNKKKADSYFNSAFIGVIIIGIIFTLLTNIFLKDLAYFLGANENSIDLVMEYGRCISLFIPTFIASNFLSPIVRNKKSPKLAMMSVLIGAGLNIILDYIFVFPMNMGMIGAALATVIGSLTTSLVLLTHFIKKENRIQLSLKEVSFEMIQKIIGCGGSTFLMEVASGFVIFIFNIQILKYIGDIGIVVYGIISNCVIVGMALFNGVAQASQPIIATNYGAKENKRVQTVLKYAMITTILIGGILFAIVFVFTEEVICTFVKADEQII
ncbi:MAG: MATE family efflux transporter, partial [Clostridium sp.]|nr:MATE family efflux transporter [Clostridium sp.]